MFPYKSYRIVETNFAGVNDYLIEIVPKKSKIIVEWFSRTGEVPIDNAVLYSNNASNYPLNPSMQQPISKWDNAGGISPSITTGDMVVPAGNAVRLVTAGRMNVRLHIYELPEVL